MQPYSCISIHKHGWHSKLGGFWTLKRPSPSCKVPPIANFSSICVHNAHLNIDRDKNDMDKSIWICQEFAKIVGLASGLGQSDVVDLSATNPFACHRLLEKKEWCANKRFQWRARSSLCVWKSRCWRIHQCSIAHHLTMKNSTKKL